MILTENESRDIIHTRFVVTNHTVYDGGLMETLHDAEFKFMNLVWDNEPINSTELARICQEKLGWKKSTSYNMIRKLGKKEFLQNNEAIVVSLVARRDVRCRESKSVVKHTFGGSLPAFVAAYLDGKKLSIKEAEELSRLIEEARDE